jgi:hypothetical protein
MNSQNSLPEKIKHEEVTQEAASLPISITPAELSLVASMLALAEGKSPSALFPKAEQLIREAKDWLEKKPSVEEAMFAMEFDVLLFPKVCKLLSTHGVGVKQLRNLVRDCFKERAADIFKTRGLYLSQLQELQAYYRRRQAERRGNLKRSPQEKFSKKKRKFSSRKTKSLPKSGK